MFMNPRKFVAVFAVFAALTCATARPAGAQVACHIEWAPMRDGVTLATEVYLPPNASGRLPVILQRTPYKRSPPGPGTNCTSPDFINLASKGYVALSQDALAREAAYTTVSVQRVIEPLYWSQAVAAGRLADQGVTQREVDAAVTLHYLERGKHKTSVSSVALTINLEGPPSRGRYGFVSVDNYVTVKAD